MLTPLFSVLLLICALPLAAQEAPTNPNSILPGNPCHGQTPCQLDGREYHVKEPDGWDGVSPLPVLLHFHGWARTGAVPVYHSRISGATRRRGVLLVAPTGENKTWRFRSEGSADVAFADAVLADVAARYPIDPERLYVSGYSYGGLMAWRYACESGDGVKAAMSISATLRLRAPCAEAAESFRVVYGLKDNVLPFPFGPGGDETYPVAFWREHYGCGGADGVTGYSVTGQRRFTRTHWACGDKSVTLDVHPGGHLIPRGWIGRQLDELLGRDATYP